MRVLRRFRTLVVLASVVALFSGIVAFLIVYFTGDRVRDMLVRAFTEKLGCEVTIDALDWDLFSGVSARGIAIGPPSGFFVAPFAADALTLRYEIHWLARSLSIETVEIDAPHIVVETVAGRRNVDVLAARLSQGGDDVPGAMSPIDVAIGHVRVGPIAMEMQGETHAVRMSGCTFELRDSNLGPRRFSLDASVSCAGKSDSPNIDVLLDGMGLHVPKSRIAATLDARLHFLASGRSEHGIAFERMELDATGTVHASGSVGDSRVAASTVALDARAVFAHDTDAAALERFVVRLDDATIVDVAATLRGVAALTREIGLASLVAASADGTPRGTSDGVDRVELSIRRLALPLSALVVDGLRMKGLIEAHDGKLAGTVREILEGTPSELSASMNVADVAIRVPAMGLALDGLSGSYALLRSADERARYVLSGRGEASEITREDERVLDLSHDVRLEVERLAPPFGRVEARMALGARALGFDAGRIDDAQCILNIVTSRPFDSAGDPGDPIMASVALAARKGVLRAGARTVAFDAFDAMMKGEVDPRLTPAKPIRARLEATLRAADAGRDGRIERLRMGLDVDARVPDAFDSTDARARLELDVGRVVAVNGRLESLRLQGDLDANEIRHGRSIALEAASALPMLPKTLAIRFDVGTKTASLESAAGDLVAPARLSGAARIDLVAQTARFENVRAELGDTIELRATTRVANLFGPRCFVDVEADVRARELGKVAAMIPRSTLKWTSDLEASGAIEARLRVRGAISPRSFAEPIDPMSFPLAVAIDGKADGVSVASRAANMALRDATGTLHLGNDPAARSLTYTATGTIASLGIGLEDVEAELHGITLEGSIGFDHGTIELRQRVAAKTLTTSLSDRAMEGGASFELDFAYPRFGDLALKKLAMRVPAVGLDVEADARLARAAFGAFEPSATLRGRVDLGRLYEFSRHARATHDAAGRAVSGLARTLSSAKGTVRAELKVASRTKRTIDVDGALAFEHCDVVLANEIEARDVDGRLPVHQRLWLPERRADESLGQRAGLFGDDLEARLGEFMARMEQAKAVLSDDNILVIAPRTADYDALRPFRGKARARITARTLALESTTLEGSTLEAAWDSGVFRVDRLATHVFEGDILSDFAIQLSADTDIRVRMRGTMTDVNLDIPYALAKGVAPVSDASKKEKYRTSGTLDIAFDLERRELEGRIDLEKISTELVGRFFGALDPDRANANIQNALENLQNAERFGVRPVEAHVWISQNLLNLTFDWKRLWLHVDVRNPLESPLGALSDVALTFLRSVTIPTIGATIMANLDNVVRRVPVMAAVEQSLAKRLDEYGVLRTLDALDAHVVGEGETMKAVEAAVE